MLREDSKDTSLNISSPFMKTRAYEDMEKLYDQNNLKYRNNLLSFSKSTRDQDQEMDPN